MEKREKHSQKRPKNRQCLHEGTPKNEGQTMIYFTPKHPNGILCDRWFCYSSRKLNLPPGCLGVLTIFRTNHIKRTASAVITTKRGFSVIPD
jgi:hypothetical protein